MGAVFFVGFGRCWGGKMEWDIPHPVQKIKSHPLYEMQKNKSVPG